jgi:hypothetical protein
LLQDSFVILSGRREGIVSLVFLFLLVEVKMIPVVQGSDKHNREHPDPTLNGSTKTKRINQYFVCKSAHVSISKNCMHEN